jgi:hypothetical protein
MFVIKLQYLWYIAVTFTSYSRHSIHDTHTYISYACNIHKLCLAYVCHIAATFMVGNCVIFMSFSRHINDIF